MPKKLGNVYECKVCGFRIVVTRVGNRTIPKHCDTNMKLVHKAEEIESDKVDLIVMDPAERGRGALLR